MKAEPESTSLKINDRVEVFYDPVTMQDREGIAHIDEIAIADPELSYCLVTFQGAEDEGQFYRWVNPSSVIS